MLQFGIQRWIQEDMAKARDLMGDLMRPARTNIRDGVHGRSHSKSPEWVVSG